MARVRPAALRGSLRGLGAQVPANSAEDGQQTEDRGGRTKIYKYFARAVVKACFGLFFFFFKLVAVSSRNEC